MSGRVQGRKMVTAKVAGAETGSRRSLLWLNFALGTLVLGSAFAVIHSTHACRELYTSLQELEATQWHLQEDYGRLLLQQSTLASHHKVEKEAREMLGMRAPDLARFKVVSP